MPWFESMGPQYADSRMLFNQLIGGSTHRQRKDQVLKPNSGRNLQDRIPTAARRGGSCSK